MAASPSTRTQFDDEHASTKGVSIMIVEDDNDQMKLLVELVASEFKAFLRSKESGRRRSQKLHPFNIIALGEIKSLEQAVISHKNIILALLDCHIPDQKGLLAHDQFVKNENQIITGQHRSVDIITENLPGIPIRLTTSMRRFERTIIQYYKNDSSIDIKYIGKENASKIRANVRTSLANYIQGGSSEA